MIIFILAGNIISSLYIYILARTNGLVYHSESVSLQVCDLDSLFRLPPQSPCQSSPIQARATVPVSSNAEAFSKSEQATIPIHHFTGSNPSTPSIPQSHPSILILSGAWSSSGSCLRLVLVFAVALIVVFVVKISYRSLQARRDLGVPFTP